MSLDADPVDTVDPAVAAARGVDLERALATLGLAGVERRELVRLALVEDRPLADVAARLGLPEGTVKSRLFKARQLLRAALRQGEEE